MQRDDTYYEAMLARDPRFDGKFFVGVKTTGIYCRPICPAKPWTASYMCLTVLRHTDAFPETDLILARALELHPKELVNRMSPWRGYAAALFWREYSQVLKKRRKNETMEI